MKKMETGKLKRLKKEAATKIAQAEHEDNKQQHKLNSKQGIALPSDESAISCMLLGLENECNKIFIYAEIINFNEPFEDQKKSVDII